MPANAIKTGDDTGTRRYGRGQRITVTSSNAASTAITAAEVMLHATQACFVTADGSAADTTTCIPLASGEKFHLELTSGGTINVIRDTLDGLLFVIPVIS